MTQRQVKELQRALNRYVSAHDLPLPQLDVDGDFGPLTRERVGQVKLCQGEKPKYATAEVTKAFERRLAHWTWARLYRPGMIARGIAYRKALRAGEGSTGARRALAWFAAHKGMTEQPPGSNTDRRSDGIRAAQIACAGGQGWLIGLAWCGIACFAALKAAGVKGISSRLASVALIEDDAKASRGPFKGWSYDPRQAKPGDLVVLFGRGVHVGMVRSVKRGYLETAEGNTSFEGRAGSQSNGGAIAYRTRPFGAVRGIAHVRY